MAYGHDGKSFVIGLLIAWCVVIAAQSVSAATARALNPAECDLIAVAAADDDLQLLGEDRARSRELAVPAAVAEQIRAAAKQLMGEVDPELSEGLRCTVLFPNISLVSLAGSRDLYIADIGVYLGVSYHHLLMFDPVTNVVTQAPPRMYSKWTPVKRSKDGLLQAPFVSSADLYQDGHRQIVFEEQVHNGTVYNGVIYHYFEIGPNLELVRVLARETRVVDLGSRDSLYIREIASLAGNRLRLDTFLEPNGDRSRRKAVGYVILFSPGVGKPFQIAERHPIDPNAYAGLVTTFGEVDDDDAFLREGYTNYY